MPGSTETMNVVPEPVEGAVPHDRQLRAQRAKQSICKKKLKTQNTTQQRTQNADGSIDIITIIEDTVGQYIASSRSDDAFSSRSYRLQGKQSIMN